MDRVGGCSASISDSGSKSVSGSISHTQTGTENSPTENIEMVEKEETKVNTKPESQVTTAQIGFIESHGSSETRASPEAPEIPKEIQVDETAKGSIPAIDQPPNEERICSIEHQGWGFSSTVQRFRAQWTCRLAQFRPLLLPFFLISTIIILTELWIEATTPQHRHLGWIVPFLLWLAVSLRILAVHPWTRKLCSGKVRWVVRYTSKYRLAISSALPVALKKHQNLSLAVITMSTILLGTFVPGEVGNNTRQNRSISLTGLVVFLGSFYVTSRDRTKINMRAVLGGTIAQFILGLFVLKTKAGYDIFNFIGTMAKTLLGYADDGTAFLTDASVPSTGWFLVTVAPAVTFFVAFVYLLHYWGWIGWLVRHFATVFTSLLGISGAEAIVAAASPFVGQGESAILVREYLSRLTHAEIHQVMTSGFATIAGSVMSAYMKMGISPVAIISSCVMSIPASIALSKLRYPETGQPVTGVQALGDCGHEQVEMEEGLVEPRPEEEAEERPNSALHAFSTGAGVGLRVAALIVANVLAILALLGLVNGLLGWWGSYHNVPQFSVQMILGYLLYPVAFLLGVDLRNDDGSDVRKVAQLLGVKIVANEFVAYGELTTDPQYDTIAPRSRLIAMYALCGFGNLSAVGIQIGVLSQLAPRRGGDVARVALSALVTGIVATLTSATIAGMLMTGDELMSQS